MHRSQLQEHDRDMDDRVEQVCMLDVIIYSISLLSAHGMIHGLDYSVLL